MTSETPLAHLRQLIEQTRKDAEAHRVDERLYASRDKRSEALHRTIAQVHDYFADQLSVLLTDLEAAQQTAKEQVVSRVATGATMPGTGSTANTPNGSSATLFRKKPVVISASQWFKNGDHPDDTNLIANAGAGDPYIQAEGKLVRYFRRPDIAGTMTCQHCGRLMHDHGWIETLEGGHIVCPGDWIITGTKGERYPCKPDIFAATYDPVAGEAVASRPASRDELAAIRALCVDAGMIEPSSTLDYLRGVFYRLRKELAVASRPAALSDLAVNEIVQRVAAGARLGLPHREMCQAVWAILTKQALAAAAPAVEGARPQEYAANELCPKCGVVLGAGILNVARLLKTCDCGEHLDRPALEAAWQIAIDRNIQQLAQIEGLEREIARLQGRVNAREANDENDGDFSLVNIADLRHWIASFALDHPSEAGRADALADYLDEKITNGTLRITDAPR